MSLPAPYWQSDCGRFVVYCADCLTVLPHLTGVDAVVTDPPYGKVRGEFDEQWTNRAAMLVDCEKWADALSKAIAFNGTLWWFCYPALAGRIEALIAERMNVLSHVVWVKPTSVAQKACPESLRAPHPETERIIMAEHYGADNKALGASGYEAECDKAKAFIFEPVRSYLAAELQRAGMTCGDVNRAWRAKHGGGGGMASHWFTASQWQLPTKAHYEWLREVLKNGSGSKYLRKDYENLRKDYENLRKDYENLRRFYRVGQGDPKTDVWRFHPAPPSERSEHPTPKPVALMSFIVRSSVRNDGLALDPFMGSGTTGVACARLGRRFIGIELEPKYCAIAVDRIKRELAQPCLPTLEPQQAKQEEML